MCILALTPDFVNQAAWRNAKSKLEAEKTNVERSLKAVQQVTMLFHNIDFRHGLELG